MSYQVSEKELENSVKVLDLLNQIPSISFVQQEDRPDLFVVSESESGLDAIVDVEDDTVITFIHIEDLPAEGPSKELAVALLQANDSAVHGGFAITSTNKLVFKSCLEIANLDLNELEASIMSVLLNTFKMLETLSTEEGE